MMNLICPIFDTCHKKCLKNNFSVPLCIYNILAVNSFLIDMSGDAVSFQEKEKNIDNIKVEENITSREDILKDPLGNKYNFIK